jgi:tRNA(Ile)-lysidine synthase
MRKKVVSELAKYNIDSRSKVLLTFSGGLDSRALLQCLVDSGWQPDIAHCNFNLREKDSDEDVIFCESLARQLKLNFHTKSFDTLAYADENKISIQMAARELRYRFFEELDIKHNYTAILTAHHADDQIETVLIKLARSSALEAVAGIRQKRQKFIRPLLGVYRKEIEDYANSKDLIWREDASNADTKYLRNAIRHRLLPLWEEIEPEVKAKLFQSSLLLREQAEALAFLLGEKLALHLKYDGSTEQLNYSDLNEKPFWRQLLYKWLSPKGDWDWQAVEHLSTSNKGRYIQNKRYQLYQSDGYLELRALKIWPSIEINIEAEVTHLEQPLAVDFTILKRSELALEASNAHHYLDFDRLSFPLKIRTWREGDRFQPLGMSGSKKVSDYWIDQKIPMAEKPRKLVLESAGEIAALIGHRIDHRFRIWNSTKTVYFVRLKK